MIIDTSSLDVYALVLLGLGMMLVGLRSKVGLAWGAKAAVAGIGCVAFGTILVLTDGGAGPFILHLHVPTRHPQAGEQANNAPMFVGFAFLLGGLLDARNHPPP